MTFDPIISTTLAIQFHASGATIALLLGPYALFQKRRDRSHKIAGYIWVLAMGAACISSFFIHGFGVIGPFSPLHGLALLALYGIFQAIREVIRGNTAEHARIMRSLYWRGVCIASLFNFLPGRTINRMFFDDNREVGYVIIGLGGLAILWQALRSRKAAPSAVAV